MAKPQFPSVVEFKSNVDRIADFLAAQGYDIKHMHLMEAVSRYEGARDWRTFKAQLEEKEPVQLAIPDLGGRSLNVFLTVKPNESGYNPEFGVIHVDQKWVNRLYELRHLSEKQGITIDDDDLAPHWLDNQGLWRVSRDGLSVHHDSFWGFGYDKYAGLFKLEEYGIDQWLKNVTDALGEGVTELFYLDDPYLEAEGLLYQLGPDYPDVQQRLRDIAIPRAKQAALESTFNSWGGLSFEEVCDILESGDASRRHLLVVEPGSKASKASDLDLAAWLQRDFEL